MIVYINKDYTVDKIISSTLVASSASANTLTIYSEIDPNLILTLAIRRYDDFKLGEYLCEKKITNGIYNTWSYTFKNVDLAIAGQLQMTIRIKTDKMVIATPMVTAYVYAAVDGNELTEEGSTLLTLIYSSINSNANRLAYLEETLQFDEDSNNLLRIDTDETAILRLKTVLNYDETSTPKSIRIDDDEARILYLENWRSETKTLLNYQQDRGDFLRLINDESDIEELYSITGSHTSSLNSHASILNTHSNQISTINQILNISPTEPVNKITEIETNVAVNETDIAANLSAIEILNAKVNTLEGLGGQLPSFNTSFEGKEDDDEEVQAFLNAYAVENIIGATSNAGIPNGTSVVNLADNHEWHYNKNVEFPNWVDIGQSGVEIATDNSTGIVKGTNAYLENGSSQSIPVKVKNSIGELEVVNYYYDNQGVKHNYYLGELIFTQVHAQKLNALINTGVTPVQGLIAWSFTSSDWASIESGGYSISIHPRTQGQDQYEKFTHLFGTHANIFVEVQRLSKSDGEKLIYETVSDCVSITTEGVITIFTDFVYDGNILIAGGVAEEINALLIEELNSLNSWVVQAKTEIALNESKIGDLEELTSTHSEDISSLQSLTSSITEVIGDVNNLAESTLIDTLTSLQSQLDKVIEDETDKKAFWGLCTLISELPTDADKGDYAYVIETMTIWSISANNQTWVNTNQPIPEGISLLSDTEPLANGTASAGTQTTGSRSDHVHPSDDTKVDKVDGHTLITEELYTKIDELPYAQELSTTISNIDNAINTKVDKVANKELVAATLVTKLSDLPDADDLLDLDGGDFTDEGED